MIRHFLFASGYAATVVGTGWTLLADSFRVAPFTFVFGFVTTLACAVVLAPVFALARRFLPAGAYLCLHVSVPVALCIVIGLEAQAIDFAPIMLLNTLAASLAAWFALETVAPRPSGMEHRGTGPARPPALAAGGFAIAFILAALLSPGVLYAP